MAVLLLALNALGVAGVWHSNRESLKTEPPQFDITVPDANDRFLVSEPEDPLIAVCLAGIPRSLVSPIVYKNMQENLIGALSKNAHVFAVLKMYQETRKDDVRPSVTETNYEFFHQPLYQAFPPAKLDEVNEALQYLKPLVADLIMKEADDFQIDCELKAYNSDPKLFLERLILGQMKGMWQCMQQIKEIETKHNVTFDAVVKARTDAVWLAPVRRATDFLHEEGTVRHFRDLFIFTPRNVSDALFSKFYDGYKSCHGKSLESNESSPEIIFQLGAENNGMSYVDEQAPMALKRYSSKEKRAIHECLIQHHLSPKNCMEVVYGDETLDYEYLLPRIEKQQARLLAKPVVN